MAKRRYRHQPRMTTGARDSAYSCLPPEVLSGLRDLAKTENKSVSWIIDEIVADYLGLDIFGKEKKVSRKTELRKVQ